MKNKLIIRKTVPMSLCSRLSTNLKRRIATFYPSNYRRPTGIARLFSALKWLKYNIFSRRHTDTKLGVKDLYRGFKRELFPNYPPRDEKIILPRHPRRSYSSIDEYLAGVEEYLDNQKPAWFYQI